VCVCVCVCVCACVCVCVCVYPHISSTCMRDLRSAEASVGAVIVKPADFDAFDIHTHRPFQRVSRLFDPSCTRARRDAHRHARAPICVCAHSCGTASAGGCMQWRGRRSKGGEERRETTPRLAPPNQSFHLSLFDHLWPEIGRQRHWPIAYPPDKVF